MPYLISYLLLFLLLGLNNLFSFSPTTTWFCGYFLLILTVWKKNPLDPQAWMFFSWGVLLVNVFSGVIYVPLSINFIMPLSYIISILFFFHFGFFVARTKNFKFDKRQVRIFLTQTYRKKIQLFMTVLGVIALFGSCMISFDMFILHGFSLNGGDRRAQFQEMIFTPLTTIGVMLIGGSYISGLSLFFGGNKYNKVIAIVSLLAIAIASMAIAGKQGIMIAILIVLFGFLMTKYYKPKIEFPLYLKWLLCLILLFFYTYITSLSSERHGNVDSGELLTQSERFDSNFIKEMSILPKGIKNTVAEFFGYFGDQLCTFSERWQIDNYPQKYSLFALPPRILAPFTWLERQVIKVFPIYKEIYPTPNLKLLIAKQNKGYFGLENWQTTIYQGLSIFGFFGQWVIVFFHGFYSRKLYEKVGKKITFSTLHMCLLNNIFLVYTIMMNFLGETSAFVYLVILIYLYYNNTRVTSRLLRVRNAH